MSAQPCRSIITTLALIMVLSSQALAAPHGGDRFSLAQPDGDRLAVLVWGDEFYQRVTSLDGFTLVRDPETKVICYARLDISGTAFVSTDVDARLAPPKGLLPGIELPKKARADIAAENRRPHEADAAMLADAKVDPVATGEVLGLTIIIDFSDEPGTIPAAEIERYLNQPGYDGFGNNGSIRDYFLDVSGGLLDYSNEVTTAYLRAPQPKSYYDDLYNGYSRTKELVLWGLEALDAEGLDYSRFDANDDGYIDAVNVFYAGFPDQGWSHGLWPHCGHLHDFETDGVSTFRYQLTNLGTELAISTFCHENGHMLMMWPDLYDYGFESRGIGYYGLMCSLADPANPVRPCAWCRMDAGWVEPELLTISQTGLVASHAQMNVFMISSDEPTEYYLVENLHQAGRGQALPDDGLAIWHIDHNGSNNNEQQTPESHYLVTLVQADGRWDLEHKNNRGDDTDLWRAPEFMEFSVRTNPSSTWWDGSVALFSLLDFSEPGPVMTFNFMTHVAQSALTIAPEPAGDEVVWYLSGPRDLTLEGTARRPFRWWMAGPMRLPGPTSWAGDRPPNAGSEPWSPSVNRPPWRVNTLSAPSPSRKSAKQTAPPSRCICSTPRATASWKSSPGPVEPKHGPTWMATDTRTSSWVGATWWTTGFSYAVMACPWMRASRSTMLPSNSSEPAATSPGATSISTAISTFLSSSKAVRISSIARMT